MYGPKILARSLSAVGVSKDGIGWQYHSRSDRHSKIGCWGVAFDLLAHSSLMRRHAAEGKIVLGVNHRMIDYATSRKKDLDLVIARPDSEQANHKGQTLRGLAEQYRIDLDEEELGILAELPDVPVAPVGAVLIALEAKAAMTAHVKALPRLYDELNSSHLAVHGASSNALAIAYVQVNCADTFVSPNPKNVAMIQNGLEPEVSRHKQPADTIRVLEKIKEIPRRSSNSGNGFDAIGISVFELHNDGSPVRVLEDEPAPQAGQPFHYGGMIVRMANEYDAVFANI